MIKIDQALINGFISGAFGLPIAHENVHYSPVANTAHAEISVIMNPSVPISLGAGGMDETIGLFQITLRYPENDGAIVAKTKATTILDYFYIGRVFTYSGQRVQVTAKDRGTGRNEAGWYQLIIRITFEARTGRTS